MFKLLTYLPFCQPNLQKLQHKHTTLKEQLTMLQVKLESITSRHVKEGMIRDYNNDFETASEEARRQIKEIKETSGVRSKIGSLQGEIRELQGMIDYITKKQSKKQSVVAKEKDQEEENTPHTSTPTNPFSEKHSETYPSKPPSSAENPFITREDLILQRGFETAKAHYETLLRKFRADEKALKDARWTAFQDEEKLDRKCLRCDVCLDQIAAAKVSHRLAHDAEDEIRGTMEALQRAELELKDAELRVTRVGRVGRELEGGWMWCDM